MADLGAIGVINEVDNLYPLTNDFSGIYKVSGTTSLDGVDGPVFVASFPRCSGKVIKQTVSNGSGDYSFDFVPPSPMTIFACDKTSQKSTEAITVKPNTIVFSEILESGWDAVNSGSNLTISGQTITNNSGNALAESAISDIKHEHNAWYVEILVNVVSGVGGAVGLMTTAATSPDAILGTQAESIGWYDNGDIRVNNVVIDTIGSWQANDRLFIFYDKGNVWFARKRSGSVTFYGNPLGKENPVYSFGTGYIFGYACTPYNLTDEFIVSGLSTTIDEIYHSFIPWETVDE